MQTVQNNGRDEPSQDEQKQETILQISEGTSARRIRFSLPVSKWNRSQKTGDEKYRQKSRVDVPVVFQANMWKIFGVIEQHEFKIPNKYSD